jgi:hypothetical protein
MVLSELTSVLNFNRLHSLRSEVRNNCREVGNFQYGRAPFCCLDIYILHIFMHIHNGMGFAMV